MQTQIADLPSSRNWLALYRWSGVFGYILAPFNVVAAYESARGWDLIGWCEGLWPFGLPWALFAFASLSVKDSTPQHRVYRLGLVVGLATWSATITDFVIWRTVSPVYLR
jgi:hypothetical protein